MEEQHQDCCFQPPVLVSLEPAYEPWRDGLRSGCLAYMSWLGAFTLHRNSFVLQLLPVQDLPQSLLWVLGLLMAKCPERCGGPGRMCLGRTEPEKDRGLFQPFLDHWWLWLIIFGEFYHGALYILLHITKKHYLHIPKSSTFLLANGHSLYPQWSSNTYILHGSLTKVEPPHWVNLSL